MLEEIIIIMKGGFVWYISTVLVRSRFVKPLKQDLYRFTRRHLQQIERQPQSARYSQQY